MCSATICGIKHLTLESLGHIRKTLQLLSCWVDTYLYIYIHHRNKIFTSFKQFFQSDASMTTNFIKHALTELMEVYPMLRPNLDCFNLLCLSDPGYSDILSTGFNIQSSLLK